MAAKTNHLADSRPVALVTGAGWRVGNVIARRLAACGYRLVLHAHHSLDEAQRTAEELIARGSEAIALSADLGDAAAIGQMVDSAWRHFGRIDALVNNASIWSARPLEQVTDDDVRRHFETNTLATFLCCQHVGLKMVEQATGGSIVNIGDWAIVRPYLDYAAYFASKGAIPTITRDFAVELAQRNPRVRVNAILPGPVLLPPELTAAERQRAVDATLVKREGSPEDVAHAVVFLLENPFVTGVCLPVDGGRSVYASGL